MGLAKQVVIFWEDKPVKGLIVEPGQKFYKIHVNTHQVTEIGLPYDRTRVDFEMEYHYLPAINDHVALTKVKRDQEKKMPKKIKVN